MFCYAHITNRIISTYLEVCAGFCCRSDTSGQFGSALGSFWCSTEPGFPNHSVLSELLKHLCKFPECSGLKNAIRYLLPHINEYFISV